jgi:NHL repeat
MRIGIPDRLRRWGPGRHSLAVVAAVLALAVTGTGAAAASGALASSEHSADPAAGPRVAPAGGASTAAITARSARVATSAAAHVGAPSATSQAVTAPATAAVGTLAGLPYSFPAGSGGSLVRPLGISAFQGHVYISNTSDNVLSDLNSGNTTTIAGSLEASGENGDGGPANLATLWQPTGTAEDSAGDIYIADTEDNAIRKIDAGTGDITQFAGTGQAGATGPGGPATQTRLDAPQAVAVNAAGDVFVADTDNNRVDEVLSNGHIVGFAGDGKPGYAGDGGPATRAELTEPTGVAVDSAGNVYIADAGNNVIRRVDAKTGAITTVAGDYAADQVSGGLGGFSGDGGPATSARLYDPEGVAVDRAGDLFIADTFNNAIREVTPDGTISTVVNSAGANGATPPAGGETNGPAAASKLSGPSAVAVDNSTGTLYIADTHNNKAAAVTGLAQSGSAPGPVAP